MTFMIYCNLDREYRLSTWSNEGPDWVSDWLRVARIYTHCCLNASEQHARSLDWIARVFQVESDSTNHIAVNGRKQSVLDRRALLSLASPSYARLVMYTEMHAMTAPVLGRSNRFRLTIGRAWRSTRASQSSGTSSVAPSGERDCINVRRTMHAASGTIRPLIKGKLSRRYGTLVLRIWPMSSLARLVHW